MGIAGQIGENLLRSCEGALGVDHPLALAHAMRPVRVGGLRQAPVLRTRAGTRLSVALHPSGRDLQLTPRGVGRSRRHVPLEGLPRTRAHPLQNHDLGDRGVHAPLPAARAALRLPSHPPLWTCSPTPTASTTSRPLASCCISRHRRLPQIPAIDSADPAAPGPPSCADTAAPRCSSSRPSHALSTSVARRVHRISP